jgi:hypothetical protein
VRSKINHTWLSTKYIKYLQVYVSILEEFCAHPLHSGIAGKALFSGSSDSGRPLGTEKTFFGTNQFTKVLLGIPDTDGREVLVFEF